MWPGCDGCVVVLRGTPVNNAPVKLFARGMAWWHHITTGHTIYRSEPLWEYFCWDCSWRPPSELSRPKEPTEMRGHSEPLAGPQTKEQDNG